MNKSKTGTAKSARRREELRRTLPRPSFKFLTTLQKPEVINAILILLMFVVATSMVVVWSRDQVKVRNGQVMTTTKLKRLNYTVIDEDETQTQRDQARLNSPQIFIRNQDYLTRLEAALNGLPKAVAGKTTLADMSAAFLTEFDLSEADLQLLQTVVVNGEPSPEWTRWVSRLVNEQLIAEPLMKNGREYEIYSTFAKMEFRLPNGQREPRPVIDPIEIRGEKMETRLLDLVRNAGFGKNEGLVRIVVNRLKFDAQPTFNFSEEETSRLAKAAADAIPDVKIDHQRGEILYRRGDVLSPQQYSDVVTEADEYKTKGPSLDRWQKALGIMGLVAMISVFLGCFGAGAYPRILRNPVRIAALCALMCGSLFVTVTVTAYAPIFLLPAAIGPVLFVTIIVLLAYDQRLALLLGGLQCMLITMGLEQSIGFFILLTAGCGAAITQLREVRHRNSLIHAATGTAVVLGIGTVLLGFLELPTAPDSIEQMFVMALSAVLTSYGVGFLILGILPSIERLFDITTGMTLAELRDPKRPLLRQLQQRAPGTYNHSLQVANIAEAAAEAINADSLLVYVGALYHDIGKINKPEYFVENQSGGYNKHTKLSPAMSLLVIIGHVKNGVELAREYGVPRQIQHFIESHHGTTLVEYFYHAAKNRAETADQDVPAEVEYRYPGPKPQTKEAAILMLSDAVESATRAMAEPTPSRIEGLVRKLSQKRLEDGQFDQCDLTFRELRLIEDAIIHRLAAIYHSRISYPTGSSGSRPTDQPDLPRTPQAKPMSA